MIDRRVRSEARAGKEKRAMIAALNRCGCRVARRLIANQPPLVATVHQRWTINDSFGTVVEFRPIDLRGRV